MSFSINEKRGEAVATLAANNPEDVAQSSSPQLVLQTTWDAMARISRENALSPKSDAVVHLSVDLAKTLLTRHTELLLRRFKKRRSDYGMFRRAYEQLVEEGLYTRSNGLHVYLKKVDNIYQATSTLCTILEKKQRAVETEDIRAFSETLMNESQYIEQPSTSIGGLIAYIQDKAGISEEGNFDLFRYVKKLWTPAIHVESLLKWCTKSASRECLKFKLRIQSIQSLCNNATISTKPLSPTSDNTDELKAFISEAYKRCHASRDSKMVDAVIETMVGRKRRMIGVSPTHCECLLIKYHHDHWDSGEAYIYIAVSKLSCLQCGIFLDAYNAFAEAQDPPRTKFSVAGRHNHVYPCMLPVIDGASTIIQEHMERIITRIVGAIVDTGISSMHTRSLSESTSGSDSGRSDGDDVIPLFRNVNSTSII
ncbi:hypothetical protein QCA50_017802 [Cerrena zonata]|uniref:Uncharacterized protein n=1 Tax=Cerrena zonata TaxID=2478898 RepID=A0AAW0FLZ7_9APHY